MAKSGKPFEQLTAEVIRAFNPGASVTENERIDGPDVPRQIDVIIRGFIGSKETTILIECKDWAEPVDISELDKLDSVKDDLGADLAILCTNSSFTSGALKKAARKGIGAICVLKSEDPRAKAIIWQEAVGIDIKFCSVCAALIDLSGAKHYFVSLQGNCPGIVHEVYIENSSINASLDKALCDLGTLHFDANHVTVTMLAPVPLAASMDGQSLQIVGLEIDAYFVPQWIHQKIRVDSTNGIYDFVCWRIGVAPEGQILLSFDNDKWVSLPEGPETHPSESLETGAEHLVIVRTGAVLPCTTSDCAELNALFPEIKYVIGPEKPN